MARETAAFLGERAHRFARELRRFVASGMTVRSYDRHTDTSGPYGEGGGLVSAWTRLEMFSLLYAALS